MWQYKISRGCGWWIFILEWSSWQHTIQSCCITAWWTRNLLYCIEAWGNAPDTHLKKLYILQKKILQIMYTFNDHSVLLFGKAGVLPIQLLYKLEIATIAHHAIQNMITFPNYSTTRGQRSFLWSGIACARMITWDHFGCTWSGTF